LIKVAAGKLHCTVGNGSRQQQWPDCRLLLPTEFLPMAAEGRLYEELIKFFLTMDRHTFSFEID
jgi:hypothetical protein